MPSVKPVKSSAMQWYVKFKVGQESSQKYIHMSEMNEFTFEAEQETKTTAYIDYDDQVDNVLSNKLTGTLNVDIYEDSELHMFLLKHEDESNIPCELVRVLTLSTGDQVKHANFNFNPKSITQTANDLLKAGGVFSKRGEWEEGTFDKQTLTFKPTGEAA